MLWGYFDESGKFADSDFICICGYLCDDRWEDFSREWDGALKRNKIPFLHTSALYARRPPYEKLGWTETQRDSVLIELASIISRHTLAGFGMAVDARYYRGLDKATRLLLGGSNPEIFLFHRLLKKVIFVLNQWGYKEPISLTMDWEEGYAIRCLRALSNLLKHRAEIRQLIGSIGFADDEIFYPLQAADILAYATKGHLQHKPPAYWQVLIEGAPGVTPPSYVSEFYDPKVLDQLLGR